MGSHASLTTSALLCHANSPGLGLTTSNTFHTLSSQASHPTPLGMIGFPASDCERSGASHRRTCLLSKMMGVWATSPSDRVKVEVPMLCIER